MVAREIFRDCFTERGGAERGEKVWGGQVVESPARSGDVTWTLWQERHQGQNTESENKPGFKYELHNFLVIGLQITLVRCLHKSGKREGDGDGVITIT